MLDLTVVLCYFRVQFPAERESVLCIWSHLLAQSAGNRGHADKYGITVEMGEPGIRNFFFSIFPNGRKLTGHCFPLGGSLYN